MCQTKKIMLSKQQQEIMQLFYTVAPTKIVLLKREYDEIWGTIKEGKYLSKHEEKEILQICPAIIGEIHKANADGHKIQSAVFSECAYAQTLANIFELSVFTDYENDHCADKNITSLLKVTSLVPRYVYSNKTQTKFLIQAGGCGGVDCELICLTDTDKVHYKIEYKEPKARTQTADLPKYGEDGKIVVNSKFTMKHPQYKDMLDEQKDLNFFDTIGHNTYKFSQVAIRKAIVNSYNTTKNADVIVTADQQSILTMLPANQVDSFARLEGEIRGSGRNYPKVWTPKKLAFYIKQKGGNIESNKVSLNSSEMERGIERGGVNISRYKINPLFFIKAKDKEDEENGIVSFNLNAVKQLRPCITAKMFFDDLDYKHVSEHYKGELQ